MTGWPKAPKPDNRKDTQKAVRISPELWAEVKAQAALARVTIAEFIKMMLEEWLHARQQKQ